MWHWLPSDIKIKNPNTENFKEIGPLPLQYVFAFVCSLVSQKISIFKLLFKRKNVEFFYKGCSNRIYPAITIWRPFVYICYIHLNLLLARFSIQRNIKNSEKQNNTNLFFILILYSWVFVSSGAALLWYAN